MNPVQIKECCYDLLMKLWKAVQNQNRKEGLSDLEKKEDKFKSCIETHQKKSIDENLLKQCLEFVANHFLTFVNFDQENMKEAKKEMDIIKRLLLEQIIKSSE